MTRRMLLTVVAAAAALATAAAVAAGNGTPVNSGSANALTLGVIGDVPYGATQLEQFPALIDALNGDPKIDIAVHLGDIKSGSTVCSDAYYATIAAAFSMFKDPLVYTPGDNEWTDCHRLNNGAYNPLERLAKIREVFFADPGVTLGGRKKQVLAEEGYPENVLWMQSQAVFATLHVVGSNNSLANWTGNVAPTAAQSAEAGARIAATLTWIDRAFDIAEENEVAGVVLMMQADTFEDANETLAGFSTILARIETRAGGFEGPVLLLQGDSHSFVEDQPLAGATNLTRIVVQGSNAFPAEYLRLTVDPRSPAFFSWERVPVS
jgi:hypothetical protein